MKWDSDIFNTYLPILFLLMWVTLTWIKYRGVRLKPKYESAVTSGLLRKKAKEPWPPISVEDRTDLDTFILNSTYQC